MEFKHFSHIHPLLPHQIQEPSITLCSACNSPASRDVYACSECNYFLHQQCYHEPRSLNHPSHPLHPLTLMPYPTYPFQAFIYNSYNIVGSYFSYSCSECEYDAHLHCALTPNTQPEAEAPTKQLPESVTRPDHQHPLTLYPSSPYSEELIFAYDVCGGCIDKATAMYCCRDCDFGTHLECVELQQRVEREEDIAVQMVRLQMMKMNSQMQLQQMQMNMNSQLHMMWSGRIEAESCRRLPRARRGVQCRVRVFEQSRMESDGMTGGSLQWNKGVDWRDDATIQSIVYKYLLI